MLRSVDAIVDAVGGTGAAKALAGAEYSSAISNWKTRGKIPTELFFVFSEELARIGKAPPDPAVFGFKAPVDEVGA
mgnify:CR=1 FL=1